MLQHLRTATNALLLARSCQLKPWRNAARKQHRSCVSNAARATPKEQRNSTEATRSEAAPQWGSSETQAAPEQEQHVSSDKAQAA
eukprot:643953-Lingulodinium_polyedra.AAC.1